MNGIKTLLNLEFTLSRNTNENKRKKNKLFFLSYVSTFLFALIFAFIFVGTFYYIGSGDIRGQLSLFISVIQIILLLYSLSSLIKKVFQSLDKALLSYLPVSRWQIFTAKTLFVFHKTFLLNITISLPTLIMFAVFSRLSVYFYFMSLIAVVLMPLLPFGLALLISTPMMYVQNWLKNRNLLNLLISIVITIIGFYLYSKLIFTIADIIFLKKMDSGNLLTDIAKVFSSMVFPSMWLTNILMPHKVIINIALFVLSSLLTFALGFGLGAISYNRIFVRSMIEKAYARHIKTKGKPRKPFAAFFVMEFKELFRSSNYSYTYFGMAVAMPIMVWICDRFIVNFAIERIGNDMLFGTTLLVVLVFISMICSPTASFISKEGDSFWIIKSNPRGITTPLFAKSLVGVMAAALALFATLIVLVACKFIGLMYGLVIFGLAVLYMFGLIALGLFINLLKPNLFKGHHENNFNMVVLLFISFVLSVAIGVLAIIFTFKVSIAFAMLICLGVIGVFSIITTVLLFTTYRELYRRIEA